MLQRDGAARPPRWAPAAGAALALAGAIALTWRGVTWIGSDCSCAGGALPEWSGWALIALAAPFYAAAIALVLRVGR
jgi:hypothetical protein